MIVVNASNIEKNWKWIVKHNKKFKNEISNISEETSLIAVQGPKSYDLMNEIIDFNSSLKSISDLITIATIGRTSLLQLGLEFAQFPSGCKAFSRH